VFLLAADSIWMAEYFKAGLRAVPISVIPDATAVRTASAVGVEMATGMQGLQANKPR